MKTFDQRRNEVTALYDSGQISRETMEVRLHQIDLAQHRHAGMMAGIYRSGIAIGEAQDAAHAEDMRMREARTERHKAEIDELAERLGRNERSQQGVIGGRGYPTTTVTSRGKKEADNPTRTTYEPVDYRRTQKTWDEKAGGAISDAWQTTRQAGSTTVQSVGVCTKCGGAGSYGTMEMRSGPFGIKTKVPVTKTCDRCRGSGRAR